MEDAKRFSSTMSIKGKASIAVIVVVTFVSGILVATVGTNVLGLANRVGSDSQAGTLLEPPNRPVQSTAAGAAIAFEDVFVQIAESVNPSVVQIRSERVSKTEGFATNPFEGTPFEDMFRRNIPPQQFRSNALGSGVIINADGHIITNNHVIQEAEELEVQLFNGEYYDAQVVGTDPNSDLAVIKIDAPQDLTTIKFGSFDEVRIGQWVMAFGSPLSEDLGNTVTAGIVSAVGRTSLALSQLNTFSSFIQTDAAINPGNSGGPLVNLRGELVGINSAIFSRSGGSQGIGFAIPVDVVSNVTTQLIQTGEVKRAFLGVSFGPVSPSLSDAFGVPRGAAQVEGVTAGSAAEIADLKSGDIIVAVNGVQLKDYNQLRTTIANKLPGESVDLLVVRDGKKRTITVKLGQRDDDAIARSEDAPTANPDTELESLGMTISDTSPDLLRRFGFSNESLKGAVITEIDRGSDAYREAELRQGDVITEVDRKPITSRAQLLRAYEAVDAGDMFLVRIVRPAGTDTRSFITALKKQ